MGYHRDINALFPEEKMRQNFTYLPFLILVLIICSAGIGVASAVNVTEAGSEYIAFTPDSVSVEIGDPITIEGVVHESLLGPTVGKVLLIVKAPQQSKFDRFTQVQVNDDGSFSYRIPSDATGTWSVSVKYSDETSKVKDIVVYPRAEILKTFNQLNSQSVPVSTYDTVVLTGFLRDVNGVGVADKEITYQVAIPPYGCSFCADDDDNDYLIWKTYGTARTDPSGKYVLSFTVYDRGQYKVKAYFGGDEAYQGSMSSTRSVRVN